MYSWKWRKKSSDPNIFDLLYIEIYIYILYICVKSITEKERIERYKNIESGESMTFLLFYLLPLELFVGFRIWVYVSHSFTLLHFHLQLFLPIQ